MILSIFYYSLISLTTAVIILSIIIGKFAFTINNYYIAFIIGFTVFIVMKSIKMFRDNLNFLETFRHEFTHLFFAFLTFAKVYDFSSSLKYGGNVKTSRVNPIIVLSPYTIPLIPALLSLLIIIVKSTYYYPILFIIGWTFCEYLYSALKDIFTVEQPDLKRYNEFLSYTIVIFSFIFNIMFSYIMINHGIHYFIYLLNSVYIHVKSML